MLRLLDVLSSTMFYVQHCSTFNKLEIRSRTVVPDPTHHCNIVRGAKTLLNRLNQRDQSGGRHPSKSWQGSRCLENRACLVQTYAKFG